MRTVRIRRGLVWTVCLALLGVLLVPAGLHAKSPQQIDASVTAVLKRFTQQVKGSDSVLQRANGVLVFADVIKAGIGIGGEYGEGALRVRGKTAGYYNIAAASIGLQLGAQKKDIIIIFLQQQALKGFQASDGWQVGVDGSVVLVDVGADASIDTTKLNKPIIGFVIGQKGLMYNLTLEGTKISKLKT